jgi:hypothetical protein
MNDPARIDPTTDLVRACHAYLARYHGVKSAVVAHVQFLVALIDAHQGQQAVGLHDLQMLIAQADPSLRAEFRKMLKLFDALPSTVADLARQEVERMMAQREQQERRAPKVRTIEVETETVKEITCAS